MEVRVTSAGDIATDNMTPSGAAARTLGAGKAILITFAFYAVQVVVGVGVGIFGGIWFAVTHGGLTPAVLADIQRVIVLPAGLLGLIASGAAVWLLTKLVLRGSEASSGLGSLGWRSARPRDVVIGLLLGVVLASGYMLLAAKVFPPAPGQKWGPLARAVQSGGWQHVVWAFIALLAPPVEEFLFRGVLWSGLRRSLGALFAGTAVTVLFIGSHATEALGYWPAWVAISAVGTVTLLLRVRSGSLAPPVALHAAYNAVLVLATYVATS
jgi:ABC-2 type transport system permease protein